MVIEFISFESGDMEKIIYSNEEIQKILNQCDLKAENKSETNSNESVKRVVFDIYRNLPDLQCNTVYLQYIEPKKNYTIEDVLSEYFKYYNDNNCIVITDPIMVERYPLQSDTKYILHRMEIITRYLRNVGFRRLIFNNKFSSINRIYETYMYENDTGIDFLKNNLSSNKIIKRYE